MPTVVITNISGKDLFLPDFYVELPAGAMLTTFRTASSLLEARRLQALISEGKVTLVSTPTTEEQESGFDAQTMFFTPPGSPLNPAHLYVSGVLGDDSGDGSLEHPLKTLDRAEQLIPETVRTTYTIHLRNEIYPLPSNDRCSWFRSRKFHGGLVRVEADPVWDPTVYTVQLPAFASAAGTGANLVTSSGLVVNAHRGRSLRALTGPAAGQIRRINGNTATDFLISERLSPAPVPGDQFDVITVNTEISCPNPPATTPRYYLHDSLLAPYGHAGSTSSGPQQGLLFQGLKISSVGSFFNAGDGPLHLIGVDISQIFEKCGGFILAGRPPVSTHQYVGWGIKCSGNGSPGLRSGAGFGGFFHGDTEFMNIGQGSFADVAGGFVGRIFLRISDGGSCLLGISSFGFTATPFLIADSSSGIQLSNGAYMRLNAVKITPGSGPGIILNSGSVMLMTNNVTGAGNGANSVTLNGGSKLVVTGGTPQFGGAGADWSVPGLAAFNKADLSATNVARLGTDGSVVVRS